MRFSPENQNSLTDLLAALKGGLSGSLGYSALQNIMAQQQAQVQARKEKMQGYASNLMDLAAQGYPGQTASLMADYMTPKEGVPPGVQGLLEQLYPAVGAGDADAHSFQMRQSPLYTTNPQVQAAATEGMPSPYELQIQQRWAQMGEDLAKAVNTPLGQSDPAKVRGVMLKYYSDLLALDPVQWQNMIETATGYSAVMSPLDAQTLANQGVGG